MTVLRWYVALGLLGLLTFGPLLIKAQDSDSRAWRRWLLPAQIITLCCFPALLTAAIIIAAGSISLG